MSKRQFLMILGAIVIVLLFLSIPSHWDKIILVIVGTLIIITASRLKSETRAGSNKEPMPYVEHRNEP